MNTLKIVLNTKQTKALFTRRQFRAKTQTFVSVQASRLHAYDENSPKNGDF